MKEKLYRCERSEFNCHKPSESCPYRKPHPHGDHPCNVRLHCWHHGVKEMIECKEMTEKEIREAKDAR